METKSKNLQQNHELTRDHGAQIMIVDDHEPNVRLLEGILEQAGYTRLVMTTSPHEVLSLAAAMQPGPDIVLLDLIMPGMDGMQVMEQLRALIPPGEYLPILMLTADASQESKRRALLAGANDFVTKPFDPTEMLLRINNLLQTRSLHMLLQQQNRLLEEKVQQRTEDLTQTLHQVIGAQETERRRLSMDLHDGPLQSLAVCTVAVDRVIRRQKRGEHALVLRELQELRRSLNTTIDEVRLVLADLSLEVLRNRGLAKALHDYLARFCDLTDIRADLDLDEHAIDALSPASQVLLYRLAQEALSNVRKTRPGQRCGVGPASRRRSSPPGRCRQRDRLRRERDTRGAPRGQADRLAVYA